jgi:phosphoglycolate phosphatase
MNLIGLDLDGTLEDSRRDMIASVHRVRDFFSLPRRPDARFAPWINQGMELLYRNCFDDYLEKGEERGRLSEVQTAYDGDYLENVASETRLYPGVAAALSKLALIGRLVVVTNKPEKISKRLLEELRIDHLISGLVGGDSIGKIKPDPAMLHAAALQVGFSPDNGLAFMIGDTQGDIKMGRAYGAMTIWCGWGYSSRPGEEPHLIAHQPEELPSLVQFGIKQGLKAI